MKIAEPREGQPPPERWAAYREVDGATLSLGVYEPRGGEGDAAAGRPGVVLYFGGGWRSGGPGHFAPQARHFADRGMVAFTPQYRTRDSHGATPYDCVADARAALRYVQDHADAFGLDAARLVAGGGSAGGHLACCTAFHGPDDPLSPHADHPAPPAAMLLFNPVLDTGESGFGKLGRAGQRISPLHHVGPGWPPTFVTHGTADPVVGFATVEAFVDRLAASGVRHELLAAEGEPHGFFNPRRSGDWYPRTLAAADAFLVSLGLLPAPAG